MQIPKFPLWLCALALGGSITLHAQDTAAQSERANPEGKFGNLHGDFLRQFAAGINCFYNRRI